jgi:gliding motility-associated-like protein
LTYSEVDMTLNNGYGDVITATKNTLLEDSILQNISAVKNCNETGYWIVVHKYLNNLFYAYEITAAGISAPVVSAAGAIVNFPIGPSFSGHGQLKFSPDGRHIAFAHLTAGNNVIAFFDFDPRTGIVSNSRNLPLTTPAYGISFSPDGTKLYAAGSHYSDNYLVQFNLCAGNTAAIAASRITINANASINEGIQLAPDGKIYCANDGKDSLHVINNPNALGLACNFQKNAFNALGGFVLVAPGFMMGRLCNFSLPDLIQSDMLDCGSKLMSNINFSADTVCYGLPSTLTNSSTALPGCFAQARTYKWIFGDALSGVADTAYTINATHLYSNPGSYLVSLIAIEGCEEDTLVKTILVLPNPISNAGADQSIAGGSTATLSGSGGGTYSWAPSTGLSCVDCPTPLANPVISTNYILTVTDPSGCNDIDTVFVDVFCTDLFIPNVFSPNEDGQNDEFYIHGNCFESYYLKIVDRWGNIVFETTDATEKWNGIYKQEKLNSGSFMYVMRAVTYDGKAINKKGNIALIR